MTGRSLAGVAVLVAVVLSAGFGLASAAPGEVAITFTAQPPAISNSNAATFEFTIEPTNATWSCRLDGILVSCPQLKFDTTRPLSDGDHTFTVNATAPSAEPASAAYTWRVDTDPPNVSITEGSKPTSPSSSRTATFQFTADESAGFTCWVDARAPEPCISPYVTPELRDGSHTFRVVARDQAGNTTQDSYTWTVDGPPTITIRSGPFAETSETTARFEFDVDDATAKVACNVDGGPFTACTSPYTTADLPAGSHTFVARATDAANNVALVSYTWTITPAVVTTNEPPPPPPPVTVTVAAIDTTPPDAAEALDYFIAYRYAEVTWLPPTDSDFDHVTVFNVNNNGRRTVLYSGVQSRYVNRSFNNAVDHRYQVVTYDHAGNASPVVTATISASALLATPRRGARVQRAPALRWAPVSGAAFYNIQLFRNGRKIASTWPRRPRVQLAARWHYAKHAYSLTRGTYEWWVWPAFRRGKSIRYGTPLGHSSFVKR